MAIPADTHEEALRTISLPQGPALLYITEGSNPTISILDLANPENLQPRDRAICRGLLAYVLDRFDKVTDS